MHHHVKHASLLCEIELNYQCRYPFIACGCFPKWSLFRSLWKLIRDVRRETNLNITNFRKWENITLCCSLNRDYHVILMDWTSSEGAICELRFTKWRWSLCVMNINCSKHTRKQWNLMENWVSCPPKCAPTSFNINKWIFISYIQSRSVFAVGFVHMENKSSSRFDR